MRTQKFFAIYSTNIAKNMKSHGKLRNNTEKEPSYKR